MILEVDLSKGKLTDVPLNMEFARKFIGGMGFSSKILYDNVGLDVDPFSADNLLIIAPGSLCGTSALCSSRTEITTKSPLTGTIGTGNFGGDWGPTLRRVGYDVIVFRNNSAEPKYLYIEENGAELRSAEYLWGKDAWETTDILKEELGRDTKVLAIGQAGENMVRFACPIAEYDHAPGRSTTGGVMGAKKLKAIAVRGGKRIDVARPSELQALTKEGFERVKSFPGFEERKKYGCLFYLRLYAELGKLPGKNYQTPILPNFLETRTYEVMVDNDNLKVGEPFGPNCPMGCDLVFEAKTGKYAPFRIGGVAATVKAAIEFGGRAALEDIQAVYKCKELCHRYGMDFITPLPVACELYERGIITKEDTDGVDLSWGNEEGFMEMLRKIAYRDGFGDVLAEGSKIAAEKIGKGAERYVMHIKGLEAIGSDARFQSLPKTLGTLTNPRGGDDLKSTHNIPDDFVAQFKIGDHQFWYLTEEFMFKYLDMFEDVKNKIYGTPPRLDNVDLEGKAMLTKWYGDLYGAFNALGVCMFPVTCFGSVGPTFLADMYSACTGWDVTALELMETGERIYHVLQAYGAREGFTRKDERLPARFYEPVTAGPLKGTKLSEEKINKLLDHYYRSRGWDEKSGLPTSEKLIQLGLSDIADELTRLGKLK